MTQIDAGFATQTDDSPAPEQLALYDREEAARLRAARINKIARWLLPMAILVIVLGLWQGYVVLWNVPHYILPSPLMIARTLVTDFGTLSVSWWATSKITFAALILAVLAGGGLAVLFTQSRWLEMSLFPYMVVLQVTPIIAIAPLIFIYIDSHVARVLFCAWIVAFFPVLSNTALGLNSTDHNLRDLMSVYRVSRWQRFRYLQLPGALPYFLGGLRIAGGLSLIGAVVAEFTMGSGGQAAGLAFRIMESSYRMQIPRMFAALILIVITGVIIYLAISLLTHVLLHKWHESAIKRDT